MPFSSFISDRLLRHDIDYVCDLFSPSRLEPSSYLDRKANSVRTLLGSVLDFVLNSNSQLLRYTKSQRLQELFFFTLLNGKLDSYLEAGANDGILYSNTYAFYTLLKCSGVCIEASPRLFKSLAENRPNDLTLNYALTSTSGEYISLYDDTNHGLFGRIDPSGNDSSFNCSTLMRETVQSITFKDVLSDYSKSQFSFMSLDIEGSELDALSVLTSPIFDVACVEANSSAQKAKLTQLLKNIGCSCFDYPFASNEIVAISHPSHLNQGVLDVLTEFHSR